jgi:predicted ATP-dependent endonuclease of OLD family
MPTSMTINVNRVTNKFISKATCMSFPLVGNPSFKERLRTSRNDNLKRIAQFRSYCLLLSFLICMTAGAKLKGCFCFKSEEIYIIRTVRIMTACA